VLDESPLFRPNQPVRVLRALLSQLSWTAWDKYLQPARFGLLFNLLASSRPPRTFVPD
ncbi:hypothetical protein KI387_008438, partial [Taxus chinensis]